MGHCMAVNIIKELDTSPKGEIYTANDGEYLDSADSLGCEPLLF